MKKVIYFLFITAFSLFIIVVGFSFSYSSSYEKKRPAKELSKISQEDDAASDLSYNTVLEETAEEYTIPDVITSKEQWLAAIKYCIDNLYDEITFNFDYYNENTYDIHSLDLSVASINAEGSIKDDKTAAFNYKFTYKENYILNKAAKDDKYTSMLTPEQRGLFNEVKRIANNITNDNMTNFEKEIAIHNYIISNFSYSENITDSSYTIGNLIKNKTGVCEAYAYTFQLLCTFSGLECDIVTGTLNGTEHGWNMIKLGGKYYHVDVTSDDPVPDKKDRILYGYLNLSDEEIAKTHTWDRNNYPECTASKYNYYIYNNLVVETPNQMQDLILSGLNENKKEIYFYAKNFSVRGKEDFDFCNKARNLDSYSLVGNIGSDGEFLFIPTYR